MFVERDFHFLITVFKLAFFPNIAIIVVTDGIINIPDIHLFQSLLAQLRNSAISCSFLHIGSNHQPDCCWGYPTFPDLMQFIATATYGACISLVQDVCIPYDVSS